MWSASIAAGLVVALAAEAMAQSTETQASATGQTQAQGSLEKSAPAEQANAEAQANAKTEAEVKMAAIVQRGARTSAKTRSDADAKIQSSVNDVNLKALGEGNEKVADRLGTEFGTTADAMLAEKQSLGASWGDLMIAHTLEANSKAGLTVEQVYQMKKEGSGWGLIAAGMGFKLGEVVSAAQAESRVANGLVKADGKVHPMNANAAVNAGAGVKGGLSAGAGVKADAGVGVKVGHP
jgi:hypothetical protein